MRCLFLSRKGVWPNIFLCIGTPDSQSTGTIIISAPQPGYKLTASTGQTELISKGFHPHLLMNPACHLCVRKEDRQDLGVIQRDTAEEIQLVSVQVCTNMNRLLILVQSPKLARKELWHLPSSQNPPGSTQLCWSGAGQGCLYQRPHGRAWPLIGVGMRVGWKRSGRSLGL